jgi:NAD(P)-dependent dehydrogenase (short-subunit alcohol dehydrogenase family)
LLENGENRRSIERTIPLGRVGQADEFAATIVFLGSRALSYMATTMVMVDDGTVAQ